MLAAVFQAITWGLLSIFVVFLLYGISIAVFTLVKFYRAELASHVRSRPRNIGPAE